MDGMATYPQYQGSFQLKIIDFVCLMIFVVEMSIKLIAQGSKPWRFFIGLERLRMDSMNGLTSSSWELKELRKEVEVEEPVKTKTTVVTSTLCAKEKETEQTTTIKTTTTYVYHDFTKKELQTEADRFWNCFDFLIVGCCIFITFTESDSFVGTLRLLRILRLIRTWEELRAISVGLISGLQASGAIMFLFIFVIFLYSLVGVDLFRENDPLHFLNGQMAFYTLYGISNMEWLEVSVQHFYGCNSLKAGGYYQIFLNSSHPNYPKLDAELEVIDDYFEGIHTINRYPNVAYRLNEDTGGWLPLKEAEDPFMPKELWCAPKKQLGFAVIYFTSYVCVTGLILITLFTGAVAVAMTDSVKQLEEDKKDAARDKRKAQLDESFTEEVTPPTASQSFLRIFYSAIGFGDSCEAYETPQPLLLNAYKLKDDRESTSNHKRMLCGLMPNRSKNFMVSQMKLAYALHKLHPDGPSTDQICTELRNERHLNTPFFPRGKGLGPAGVVCANKEDLVRGSSSFSIWIKFKMFLAEISMTCFEISRSRAFILLVNATIFAAAIFAGIALFYPKVDLTSYNEHLLTVMKIVFSLEFLVKIISEGCHPFAYFGTFWNVFDFVILGVTLAPNPNQALASLRALRLLKLIKSMSPEDAPQLHIVLAAFNDAIMSFQYVGALWILIIYIYAIVGFTMYGANDPANFGTLHGAIWTLFGASTFDGVSDLMYTQIFGCDMFGTYIEYPFFGPDYYEQKALSLAGDDDESRLLLASPYDSIPGAPDEMTAMFMRELRGGKKKKKRDFGFDSAAPCVPTAAGNSAFLYFLSYTTLSALILLSILLGVIQSGMEDADDRNRSKAEREDQIQENVVLRPKCQRFLPLLCDVYDDFDPDDVGTVPIDELIASLGGSSEEMSNTKAEFYKLDDDGSGTLELGEFCELILSRSFDSNKSAPDSTVSKVVEANDGSML
jgi:hypothetical protein